jgi:hypothetical protein
VDFWMKCAREKLKEQGLPALKLILITFSDIILKSEIPIKIKFLMTGEKADPSKC